MADAEEQLPAIDRPESEHWSTQLLRSQAEELRTRAEAAERRAFQMEGVIYLAGGTLMGCLEENTVPTQEAIDGIWKELRYAENGEESDLKLQLVKDWTSRTRLRRLLTAARNAAGTMAAAAMFKPGVVEPESVEALKAAIAEAAGNPGELAAAAYDKEAILDDFAVEPDHGRATMERYLKQYPHLAGELIDLASEIRLGNVLGPQEGPVEDPRAAEAWQEYLNAGRRMETKETPKRDPLGHYTIELYAKGQSGYSFAPTEHHPHPVMTVRAKYPLVLVDNYFVTVQAANGEHKLSATSLAFMASRRRMGRSTAPAPWLVETRCKDLSREKAVLIAELTQVKSRHATLIKDMEDINKLVRNLPIDCNPDVTDCRVICGPCAISEQIEEMLRKATGVPTTGDLIDALIKRTEETTANADRRDTQA